MPIPENRALTEAERKLLEWLIDNGEDRAKEYAHQLAQIKVVGHCKCGCPSLHFAIGEDKHRAKGPSTILAEVGGISPEGVPVLILLHAKERKISLLEVVSTDESKSYSLPTPEILGKWR